MKLDYLEISRTYPLCFEKSDHYALWKERNITQACTDCTPAYQQKMRSCGKCQRPEIKFFETSEKEIYGATRPRTYTVRGKKFHDQEVAR